MTTQRQYAVFHRALLTVGTRQGLTGNELRVLVAIKELLVSDGIARTDLIEHRTMLAGACVRRCLLRLRPVYAAGGDRRGVRLPLTLTQAGELLVREFIVTCFMLSMEWGPFHVPACDLA